MIVVVAIVVVAIPIALIVPLVSAPIPPSVILIPAAVALGVQITPAFRSFAAALAMLANRMIKPGFCFLDAMLAFRVIVVRMHAWYRAQRQYRGNGNDCSTRFSYLQVPPYIQRILLGTPCLRNAGAASGCLPRATNKEAELY